MSDIRKVTDTEVVVELRRLYAERDRLDGELESYRQHMTAIRHEREDVQSRIDGLIRPVPLFEE